MSAIQTAATVAYRLTAEGVETVSKAFDTIRAKVRDSLGGAGQETRKFSGDLGRLTEHLSKVSRGVDGLARLRNTLLTLSAAGGLTYLVKNSLDAAANIEDLARQAGVSKTAFQQLEFALKGFNVSQQETIAGLRTLSVNAAAFVTQNAGPGKDAFTRLGFSQKDVQLGLRNADQFFETVLQRLGTLKSEAEKLQLAQAIFGKDAGSKLAGIQIDQLRAAREEAEKLGYVLSDELISASNAANNRLTVLGDVLQRQLAVAVAENAEQIKHFTDIAIQNLPTVIGLVDKLVTVLAHAANGFKIVANSFGYGLSAQEQLNKIYTRDAFDQNLADQEAIRNGTTPGIPAFHAPFSGGDLRKRYDLENQLLAQAGLRFGSTKASSVPATDAPFFGGQDLVIGDGAKTKAAANEAESLAKANAKVIEGLREQANALALTGRAQAVYRAEANLNTKATAAQHREVAALAGALYDAKRAEEVRDIADDLRSQAAATGLSAREQFLLNAELRLGAEATAAERQQIRALADETYTATERSKAWKSVTDSLNEAFADLATSTDGWADSLRNLARQLISVANQQLLAGAGGGSSGGGIGGLIVGGIKSLFGFGGGRAEGGPVAPWTTYLVGEKGPELLRMGGQGGSVVPNKAIGGGNTYNIYPPAGADPSWLAEIRTMIMGVDGKVERYHQAVPSIAAAAVQDRFRRSPGYMRR